MTCENFTASSHDFCAKQRVQIKITTHNQMFSYSKNYHFCCNLGFERGRAGLIRLIPSKA